jgi:hypothetical protein
MKELEKDTKQYQVKDVRSKKAPDWDDMKKEFVGEKAIWGPTGFQPHYKDLKKIKDENVTHDNDPTSYTRMLVQAEKDMYMPKKFNIIKFSGKKE